MCESEIDRSSRIHMEQPVMFYGFYRDSLSMASATASTAAAATTASTSTVA